MRDTCSVQTSQPAPRSGRRYTSVRHSPWRRHRGLYWRPLCLVCGSGGSLQRHNLPAQQKLLLCDLQANANMPFPMDAPVLGTVPSNTASAPVERSPSAETKRRSMSGAVDPLPKQVRLDSDQHVSAVPMSDTIYQSACSALQAAGLSAHDFSKQVEQGVSCPSSIPGSTPGTADHVATQIRATDDPRACLQELWSRLQLERQYDFTGQWVPPGDNDDDDDEVATQTVSLAWERNNAKYSSSSSAVAAGDASRRTPPPPPSRPFGQEMGTAAEAALSAGLHQPEEPVYITRESFQTLQRTIHSHMDSIQGAFSAMLEESSAAHNARMRAIEDRQTATDADISSLHDAHATLSCQVAALQKRLDEATSAPSRPIIPPVSDDFDRALDDAILLISTHDAAMVTADSVRKSVDEWLSQDKFRGNYELLGEQAASSFVLRFHGQGNIASSRRAAAKASLRYRPSPGAAYDYRDILATEVGSGAKIKLYINNDRNQKQIRSGQLARLLGEVLQQQGIRDCKSFRETAEIRVARRGCQVEATAHSECKVKWHLTPCRRAKLSAGDRTNALVALRAAMDGDADAETSWV